MIDLAHVQSLGERLSLRPIRAKGWSLEIAADLTLPPEAVTQTFGMLAKRGVGKTYTALVFVEELLKAQQHVVVVDPIGVCWGLRGSADGKHPGLPIIGNPAFQKILGKLAQGERFQQGQGSGHAVPPIRPASEPKSKAMPGGAPLPPGELATLTAALQYPDGLDRKRLGMLTGYKRSSRDAYIARLQQKGLVEVRGVLLVATDAGRAALNGRVAPLPTGDELIAYWMARLPEGERKIFDVLISEGREWARDALDERTGYKRSSRRRVSQPSEGARPGGV